MYAFCDAEWDLPMSLTIKISKSKILFPFATLQNEYTFIETACEGKS